jgi:hypothetical protein
MKDTHTCLRCGKSWTIYWKKNKDKLPKACRFCASTKWHVPKQPRGKELLKFLLRIDKVK